MLPVGFSRSSYDFIDSNPYILDQNSGVPVTCVFHAWFDAYDLIGGAKGRNTVISVGLWAWQMESSRAVSQLPCGSHVPEHHPWAQKEKRGWWFCYPVLRSAPPGTLNLNRTTVFGTPVTLFEKHWAWMRMSFPLPPWPTPRCHSESTDSIFM